MSGMAEVLAAHQKKTGVRDMMGHCWCGWAGGRTEKAFVAHQAAMLTAAGFGPAKEAAPPEVRYATLTSGETELDEVVARDAYVHLEAMDDNHWWLLVTSGGQSVHVNFYTKRAKISGHAEVEEAVTPRAAVVRGGQ